VVSAPSRTRRPKPPRDIVRGGEVKNLNVMARPEAVKLFEGLQQPKM
jgi:hypothetical protein